MARAGIAFSIFESTSFKSIVRIWIFDEMDRNISYQIGNGWRFTVFFLRQGLHLCDFRQRERMYGEYCPQCALVETSINATHAWVAAIS